MTRAVLWDLDGTILDPVGSITEGIAHALVENGYKRPSDADLVQFVGPPIHYSLEHFTEVPQEKFADIIATYRGRYLQSGLDCSRLYPGIREALDAFKDAGYVQAVATQKPLHVAQEVVRRFDLAEYFEVIGGSRDEFSGQNLHMPADKAGIIAYGLEKLRKEYGDITAVMVGDRLYDGEGACIHGIAAVGVTWGYGDEVELKENFEHIASTSHELVATVRGLLPGTSENNN
ncbi:HAD hydrolase-like protein [Rothia sp. ZJ1223]|uniref:HAD hydrolase-like protein n=1 Tax=Rothia sp. ZJ1223 TaxID=2811098 RepID=UPI001957209B|nr:HAD hydrolase-like protein [Rothia sp. ZJ1223]MBM7050617.1 HAD hydrolase-like protein [Rothia sp. ZJ1223]